MITFKQIQLVGFKSFADKTTITLGEGVTCIVGPNGCGKSNVADAIKWVLGEQSAKNMRGTQMLDVIFGGTEKRRQMSMCEVTLTFDNTNRIFDVDSDEVEMTRRLYRDGDSEYLLNKQPSRMKILTGLLHSVGAAKEGYSIIGQGRIEQIMNAKPEDRRSIFEEATGIVVFKDRKAEAERKLNASRDNLFVFSQRMQEVERQLNPLKKAAENAQKYQAIYENLRYHEMNTYILRYESAEGDKAKQNAVINECADRLRELDERADRLLNEYTQTRDDIIRADAVLADLNERLTRYRVGNEKKSGEAKMYSERAKSVKDKLAKAQESIGYSANRIEEVEKEIRRQSAYIERNLQRLQVAEQERQQLLTELVAINAKITNYEIMTGENRKKVMDTFKDLSEMKEEVGSLAAQKQLLLERLTELSEDTDKIKTEWEGSKHDYDEVIAKAQQLQEFVEQEDTLLAQAVAHLQECEDKVRLLTNRIYELKANQSTLEGNLTTVKALRDRFEGYTYSVKRLLTDAKNNPRLSQKIMGLIADVVSTSAEYEIAIETAFGGAMQNVITATRDDAKELIEYLKSSRGGQVTFLPVEALHPHYENDQIRSAVKDRGAIGFAIDLVKYDKKYENVIHNLLGNTLVCDNISSATIIARRYPRAFKIVTLEGDIIAVSGSMTGGSRRDNTGNLLSNERRIKEIEDQISANTAQLSRLEVQKGEWERKREEAQTEGEQLRQKFQSSRLELATMEERQTALLTSVTTAETKYMAYIDSQRQLEERLSELDSSYQSKTKNVGDLNEASSKASMDIDSITKQYDGLKAEREEKTETLNNDNVTIAGLQSAINAGKESIARLQNEKAELIESMDSLRAQIPVIERELESINLQLEKSALTDSEKAVVDDLHRQIDEITERKKQLNEAVKQIDIQRLEANDQRDPLTRKMHNAELALTKLTSDLENMQQRIAEEYGETYEGCLSYRDENYDITESPNAIANCKRQLTMIGPVNPNALEEYNEVSARYEQMCADKEDLEKAIADLTGALEDIRAEMLKIFDAGFNQINKNFQTTFRELFGGGRAELQMDYTDCDDPLNAGIEIVACPPGKKLTKISLLSGGERALTAIAILFAIIMLRPMPFCVLDEIEAALDDANVGRYASFLKKFAQDTQFIVITHRKPTMESADILFGVTMEEKGVSKIVSVKLSEVEEKLGGDTIN